MPLRVGAFSSGPWNFSNTIEGHGFSRAARETLRGFQPLGLSWFNLPRLKGDRFFRSLEPQERKPVRIFARCGTAEAVPFPCFYFVRKSNRISFDGSNPRLS